MRETFRPERPRVLFDVDGVIADYVQLHVNAVISAGVRDIPTTWRPTQWDISKELKLTDAEEEQVQWFICRPGMAQTLDTLPGAVRAVRRVAQLVDVYFVTTPLPDSPTWAYDRAQWLKKHFGEELGRNVVHTEHKYLISGLYLVDDKADNCRKWEDHNPGRVALCWRQPGMELEKDLICVTDWNRVETFVQVAIATRKHLLG